MVVDRACACATSAATRAAEVALGRAAHRRARAQRRRQDEPARGAVLRLHRALVPDDQRARAGALRRAGPARVVRGRSTARPRRRARARAWASSPGEPKRFKVDGAPAERLLDAPTARWSASSCPTASSWSRARRRCAARTSTRSSPRCGRRATATRRAVRAGAGTAQRAARARPGRRRRAPRWRPGTSSSRATASPLRDDRAAAVDAPAPALRRGRRPSSGSPATRSCATARARARRPPRRWRRSWPSACDADLERGFTTHGPHRDDLALLRDGRELRAYGSQGEQRMGLLALLLAERAVAGGRARRAAAAAPRRRHERARRRAGASASSSACASGRRWSRRPTSAHVPGAGDGGSCACACARWRAMPAEPVAGMSRRRAPAAVATPSSARARLAPRDRRSPTSSASGRAPWARRSPLRPSRPASATACSTVTCASAVWAQELDLMGPELTGASTRRSAPTASASCAARRRRRKAGPSSAWSCSRRAGRARGSCGRPSRSRSSCA